MQNNRVWATERPNKFSVTFDFSLFPELRNFNVKDKGMLRMVAGIISERKGEYGDDKNKIFKSFKIIDFSPKRQARIL